MAYEFSRFSTQSFERLIQALATDVVGARVRIYGAGPDGAREATYEGKCRIGAEDWDGYLVFQAKYHQAANDLARNTAWLIAQVDAEMEKFADPRRGLRRPDYYVLASNVRLSANAADSEGKGEGGIDKVTAHLSSKASELGIKEAVLWHQDTLSSLLDTRQEIRTTFAFWVQPGDVLAALLRKLEGPDHAEVLGLYLREGLRQSREIKTKDVGQTIGRTVALDEIFIDLPIDKRITNHTLEVTEHSAENEDGEDIGALKWDEEEFANVHNGRIIAELMNRAADRLSPETSIEGDASRGPLPNRVVLLGGPGQGKSTVGQFIAQLCRARLLSTISRQHAPETCTAIEAVLSRAVKEKIPIDGPLRYPFHVELPKYADALSKAAGEDRGLSILSFLAKQIGRDAEVEVQSNQLRRWLGQVPSIIILDGLDEVPASGNRSDVILAIEQLLDALQAAAADCLIFTTSRPQGYQDELSRDRWAHWHLEPLKPEDALKLARNVAPVLVSDDVRREEIVSKLAEATQEITTAPLLTSPLQVMLLFQLVATHNNIPKDRWTLFNRHYETLRDREISKSGSTGNTIGTFKQQIDGIHADAGYLLQLRAEGAGGADAYLTIDELRMLVRRRLEKDEFEESQIPAFTEQIVSVATNRLVFLRSQVDGQVAFDVRSLQEFMAAARLTTGPEAMIIPRMLEIAGRSNWLHVLRIAASKILGSTQHEAVRDGLVAMLDSLDAGDRSNDDRTLKTGSRIALQLLADGAAANVPAFRRKLIARALNILDLPNLSNLELVQTLAGALDFGQAALLEPRFTEALNSENENARVAALHLLALAANLDKGQNWPWIKKLLLSHWPERGEDVLDLLDTPSLLPKDPEIQVRLRQAQFASSPSAVVRWLHLMTIEEETEVISLPFAAVITSIPSSPRTIPLLHRNGEHIGIGFTYLRIGSAGSVPEVAQDSLPIWHAVKSAGLFSQDPSPKSAAAFLDEVMSRGLAREVETLSLPWLLRALIEDSDGEEVLLPRRSALLSGALGGASDWLACEARWERGIDIDAIISRWTAAPGSPERVLGVPMFGGRRIETLKGVDGQEDLLTLAETLSKHAWAIQTLLHYITRKRLVLLPQTIQYLSRLDTGAAVTTPSSANLLVGGLIEAACASNEAQITNKLRATIRQYPHAMQSTTVILPKLIKLLERSPDMRELIPLMVAAARLFPRRHGITEMTLPTAALECLPGDTRAVVASVTALRILSGKEVIQDQGMIEALLSWEGVALLTVLSSFARRWPPILDYTLAPTIARSIIARGGRPWMAMAYSVLEDLIEAKPVEFLDPVKAETLWLPPALLGRPTLVQAG